MKFGIFHDQLPPRRMVDASGNEQGEEWLERFAAETVTGGAGSTFDLLG